MNNCINYKCLMQETTRILRSKVLEDQNTSEIEPPSPLLRSSSQPTPPTKSDNAKREIKHEERERRKQVREEGMEEEEEGNMVYMVAKTEDKAAKIRRLKSGFRICKPQGTFLWPNMAMSPHSVMQQLQADDPLVVPTPPSASSSTAAPRLISVSPSSIGPHPTSPVKPLARRPLSTTTTTSTRPNLINLNEVPPHGPCDLAFCGTLTYQRRHSNATACYDLPNVCISQSLSSFDDIFSFFSNSCLCVTHTQQGIKIFQKPNKFFYFLFFI